MNILVNSLREDLQALDKRFNKGNRDIGDLAVKKPKLIEKIINKLNLVRREEFEIQKELLEKMSKEINQVKRNVIKKRKKRFSKKGKKF